MSLECCICFGAIHDAVQLPCAHLYCRCCMIQWAQYDEEPVTTCPMCRTPIQGDLATMSAPLEVQQILETFQADLCKNLELHDGSVTVGDEVLYQGPFATGM